VLHRGRQFDAAELNFKNCQATGGTGGNGNCGGGARDRSAPADLRRVPVASLAVALERVTEEPLAAVARSLVMA